MAAGLLDPSWTPAPHAGPSAGDARHDDAEQPPPDGAASPGTGPAAGPHHTVGARELAPPPRKLVLCFDGTGNKFHGDERDSNILNIYRMLDRTACDQYSYYQPGIGTYIVSGSLSHSGYRARLKAWYQKAKDSAVGSSFDQHVVAGYRFLMRFYNPGDEIYMFGFSRGAYIVRFLAEMIDHIGLLSHGNAQMVQFAWRAFAQWQSRRQSSMTEAVAADAAGGDGDKARESARQAHKMFLFMKGFRETFSRPVGRIRFLGLFDTVNSVPRFETAWMQRSKFPYTARSSARVIRHAVSIDERRAKFRQDLMYQSVTTEHHHHHHRRHRRHSHVAQLLEPFRRSLDLGGPSPGPQPDAASAAPASKSTHLSAAGAAARPPPLLQPGLAHCAPYRPRSRSGRLSVVEEVDAMSCASSMGPTSDAGLDGEDCAEQDIDEVWFADGHGDVGGGWEDDDGDGRKSTSHVPLCWIFREAAKAGLPFDMGKVSEMGCMWDAALHPGAKGNVSGRQPPSAAPKPFIRITDERNGEQANPVAGLSGSPRTHKGFGTGTESGQPSHIHEQMHQAHTSRIHDSLVYGGGLSAMAVTSWRMLEWLPLMRMDLQPDGSWKPIRWPLPRGEVRDIPPNVRVHGSVIRRLHEDETYRPGNLIVGGGGRGLRRAPPHYGIGEWVCVAEPGDPIGEIWVKKERPAETNGN